VFDSSPRGFAVLRVNPVVEEGNVNLSIRLEPKVFFDAIIPDEFIEGQIAEPVPYIRCGCSELKSITLLIEQPTKVSSLRMTGDRECVGGVGSLRCSGNLGCC